MSPETPVLSGPTAGMIPAGAYPTGIPTAADLLSRVVAAGYRLRGVSYVVGENIAWGTYTLATPASIVSDWMHSEGHRANILDRGFRKTGMGVAPVHRHPSLDGDAARRPFRGDGAAGGARRRGPRVLPVAALRWEPPPSPLPQGNGGC